MASPSPEVLAEKFELIGSWGLRATAGTGLGTGVFLTLPTASVDYRGLMLRTEGDTGVADQIVVCRKNTDDAYEWIEVNDTLQIPLGTGADAQTWTDLAASPATDDNLFVGIDLAGYAEVRFSCYVDTAGSAGSVLRATYSTDFATFVMVPLTTNEIDLSQTGVARTDWESIPEGARGICFLGIQAEGGNGSADPVTNFHTIQIRR